MSLRHFAPAVVLALAGCYASDINPMERQAKYLPYQQSEFYEDGRAMRTPPAGTVPRERKLTDPMLDVGLLADGTWVQQFPVPVTAELLKQGRRQYDIVCATCHGLVGDGDAMVSFNMAQRPAPSLHGVDITPGRVYEIVRDGYGLMPPFGAEIPVTERWAVAAYVRALKVSQGVPVSELPENMRLELMKEKQ